MLSKHVHNIAYLFAIILIALGIPQIVNAQSYLPNYELQFLGTGAPVAINNSNVVVGSRLVNNNYQPLVSINGSTWEVLPLPSGGVSAFPTDVNDSGVIVGVSYNAQFNAIGVRWLPGESSYTVEVLPRLTGDNSSYPTGINNLGQIVGARRALGYIPAATTGWLFSDELGVVDLTQYGFWIVPADLNDNGIVIGGTERLDLNTGVVEVLPLGPSNYYPITAREINASGKIAGSSSLRSSSLNIVSIFLSNNTGGWDFIAGTSRYTAVSSLNNLGDMGYSELGSGLYLDGLGTYPLWSLLDPDVVSAGWSITGSTVKINDQRAVAATASNTSTGQSGGVLLIPSGTLPPPTAPINLVGVPHSATRMEPYNSINLTWENTSSATFSYELQRSESGSEDWVNLVLTPPGNATNHADTTVGLGIAYDYRVRAIGQGGASTWSEIATVTSPDTPLDTTPPTVTIMAPANGATVSGNVTISAVATDDVAIEYLEISYWDQYLGQEVILGSVDNAGSLSLNWNTSSLTPATYAIWAYAYDPLGNWTQTEISVNVTTSVSVMRVTSIAMSGFYRNNRAGIAGEVFVKTPTGTSVANATISVQWTLPDGTTQLASATTNSIGRARFLIYGTRGTYTLTILNVTKPGFVYDPTNSVTSRSITR